MKNILKNVLLVDDNPDDNFIHKRIITKTDASISVVAKEKAVEALDFLQSNKGSERMPDLIFLDVNMPGMNAWDFLKEYDRSAIHYARQPVIVILTTSNNPDDETHARLFGCVFAYKEKPLTKGMLLEIKERCF